MAVNINELQVEVQDRQPAATASQQQPKPQTRAGIRQDLEMLAERQLRLKGD